MAAPQSQPSKQGAAALRPDGQNRHNSAAENSVQSTKSADSLPTSDDDPAQSARNAREGQSTSHNILDHFKFSRATTDLRHVPTDESVNSHRFVIRRPRVLQVKYDNRIVPVGDEGVLDVEHAQRTLEKTSQERSNSLSSDDEPERRTTDFLDLQRDRVELFIDLLFVGIITNLSEHFFVKAFSEGGSVNSAISEFILLFLPTWRIFWELQTFLSCYFMDDMLQRLVILAVIVLSLIWGNNAPFFLGYFNSEETQAESHFTIATYLIATSVLRVLEIVYSIWIPWMRRLMLVGWVVTIPSTGLWVGIILTTGYPQISLLIAVLCFDYTANVLLRSPLADKLNGGSKHLRKALDLAHTRRRYEQFFTIALGEGVILLLRNSPLGQGWGRAVGAGIQVILIYFFLHWLYFNGAQSKSHVHALHRRWFYAALWYLAHVTMYASMLLMSSSMLALIEYSAFINSPTSEASETAPAEGSSAQPTSGEGAASTAHRAARMLFMRSAQPAEEPTTDIDTHAKMRVAAVTACATLATTLFMTLIIALCNRPLDGPRTLRVNQRLVRLAPRAGAVVLFALIWLVDFAEPVELLGVLASALTVVNMWEWACALEHDWSWVQPK